MKVRSIALLVTTVSALASAQTAPLAVAEKLPLATHNCAKPAMPDASKKLTSAEANAFVRTLETFRNCVQAFSESQKTIIAMKQKEAEAFRLSALEASTAASAAASAADAAAKDYNAFSEQAIKIVTPKESDTPKKTGIVEPPAARPQRSY